MTRSGFRVRTGGVVVWTRDPFQLQLKFRGQEWELRRESTHARERQENTPTNTHILRIASCPSKTHTFIKFKPFDHVSMSVYTCTCKQWRVEGYMFDGTGLRGEGEEAGQRERRL